MFSFFRSSSEFSPIESGRAKIVRLVETHLHTLALKRRSGISIDSYGKVDATRWNAEVQYFLDKIVLPELTESERLAIGAFGLSQVANDLIETPVRKECPDWKRASACDLTVFSLMGFALTTSTMRLATRPRRSKRRLNL